MSGGWRDAWRRQGERWSVAAVVLATLLASAASLRNGFALDDVLLIETEPLVQSLKEPWRLLTSAYWRLPPADTLWRPLGLLAFAVQWALGDGSPLVFHAANLALYLGVSLLVLQVGRQLLPSGAALAAALLFAVHPVHVESVGNIVGQLELAVAAALLGAIALYLRDRLRGTLSLRTGALIVLLFVIGLGFKEHALLLPLLLLLLEATVLRGAGAPASPGWSRVRLLFVALGAVAVAWMLVRSGVLGGDFAGDRPHRSLRGLDLSGRAWVMLGLVPEIARLLVWPARLYADYSPQFVPVLPKPALWHFVGALVVLAWAIALVRSWRGDRVLALGLLWIPGALFLVSNILVPTGVLLAERTLFLASVGPVLIAGALWARLVPRFSVRVARVPPAARTAFLALAIGALALVAAHSSQRQLAWRDNTSLLSTLVVEAPENFRGHYWLGDSLLRAGALIEGERAMLRAMALWPEHDGPPLGLALYYQRNGLCIAALPLYRRVIALEPDKPTPRFGQSGCLISERRYTAARAVAVAAVARGMRATRAFNFLILQADSALAAHDSVLPNNRWIRRRDRSAEPR